MSNRPLPGARYNNPQSGKNPSIGKPRKEHYIMQLKKLRHESDVENSIFSQLVSHDTIPFFNGTTLKGYRYEPLLSDANINDQGINALGIKIKNGNLYGSSKDINLTASVMPIVTEDGSRVNRVGFSKNEFTGDTQEFGMFFDYTEDSILFDPDGMWLNDFRISELIKAAHSINERLIQMDLLYGASTLVFPGTATRVSELGLDSYVSYKTLRQLQKALDIAKCPKNTVIISGTDKVDTKTTFAERILLTSCDVVEYLRTLKTPAGDSAWISMEKYAASVPGGLHAHEKGIIAGFRVFEIPEMLFWSGGGADVQPTDPVKQHNGKADVFPLLVVGRDSFTAVRFTGSHDSVIDSSRTRRVENFDIKHKKPGYDTMTMDEPYGKYGIVSIRWRYGALISYPERIGLIRTALPSDII